MKRLFLKIVAASLLGAQLLGTASVLAESRSVDHYLCLEHQEWTHEGKGSVARAGHPFDSRLDLLKSPAGESAEHEHCELLACSSRAKGEPRRSSSTTLDRRPGFSLITERPGAALAPRIPLYRLAPKNSPPLLSC